MYDRRRALLALGALFLGACATTRPGFEEPTVMLSSFRMLPSEQLAPRFLIGLRVINPNSTPLNLRGLSYNVDLEGHRLLTGVAGNLAKIPPYAESEIELQAGTDLLSGLRFINELINDPARERFAYTFHARLDVAGMVRPLNLEEKGELSLGAGPPLNAR